jgi:hypothetical protein
MMGKVFSDFIIDVTREVFKAYWRKKNQDFKVLFIVDNVPTQTATIVQLSSSSSVGVTTLGGFWPALRFRSTVFYLYTSLSSFSLSSSLNPLLLDQAISVLVILLVFLMNMFPIQLIFLPFLLSPF